MSNIFLEEKLSDGVSPVRFTLEQKDYIKSLFEVQDDTVVWVGKRHVSTLLCPANARKLVKERMIRRILDNPALLDEVRDRLENDDIVD